MAGDWMPSRQIDFYNWVVNVILQYQPIIVEVAEVSADMVRLLNEQIPQFKSRYDKVTSGDNSVANVHVKNETMRELKQTLRDLYNQFIRFNTYVSDENKITWGFPVYDNPRRPLELANDAPILLVETTSSLIHKFTFTQHDKKRGKPIAAEGLEIRRFIGDVPPKDPNKYEECLKLTGKSDSIVYAPTLTATDVYYIAAFYGRKNRKSSWCLPVRMSII